MAGVVELALVVLTMKLWPKVFAGAPAMAAGVLLLIGFAVVRDAAGSGVPPGGRRREEPVRAGGAEGGAGAVDPVASLFGASAARLRRVPAVVHGGLGAGVCVLAQLHIFGGGEATSFLIAKGQYSGGGAGRFSTVRSGSCR